MAWAFSYGVPASLLTSKARSRTRWGSRRVAAVLFEQFVRDLGAGPGHGEDGRDVGDHLVGLVGADEQLEVQDAVAVIAQLLGVDGGADRAKERGEGDLQVLDGGELLLDARAVDARGAAALQGYGPGVAGFGGLGRLLSGGVPPLLLIGVVAADAPVARDLAARAEDGSSLLGQLLRRQSITPASGSMKFSCGWKKRMTCRASV